MARSGTARLVLLGTSGGPLPSPLRAGIAQAVVVAGRAYLVDCGYGVARQLRRARLLSGLAEVYLTHLHSDHDCDLFTLFLLGWPILQDLPAVHAYGPGPAGGLRALPPDQSDTAPFPIVNKANPTPGLIDALGYQLQAHAYDVNIRLRDSGRTDLTDLVVPHEIEIPAALDAAGPDRVAPEMEPIVVTENDDLRVSAILVAHGPVFPAFAYRFDTADGSIVLSGDTTPTPNLITLAAGADILVHEVYTDEPPPARQDEEPTWASRQRERHLVASHTPLSQVGKIAATAGVGRLVLTHFIPGDDALPDEHWLGGVGDDFDGEVVVGRDLLELRL